MQGKFIALEGGEGSGKDTMIDRLKKKYANRTDIVFTREPGGTEVGEEIRALLLSPETKNIDPLTELLLFVAARAQLVKEVIRPSLMAGKTVISNRFGLSTRAYQIYGRQRHEHLAFLDEISQMVVGDCSPTYILLNVTPGVGLSRVKSRGDGLTRFDAERLEFHERVQQGYLMAVDKIDTKKRWVINADQSVEVVWAVISDITDQLIKSA